MRESIYTGENAYQNDTGMNFVLKYYIVKDYMIDQQKKPLFGIAIYKYDREADNHLVEKEESTAITHSNSIIKKMVEQLMQLTITPTCMLEVLDDLVSKNLEEYAVL